MLVAGALLALMLCLGFWQLDRARFKDVLEARFAANATAPVESVVRLVRSGDSADWYFRRARTSGHADGARQYLLDNRTFNGQAGYHVLMAITGPEGSVLVNRGWVPVGSDRSVLPQVTLATDELEVEGRLVALPEEPLLLGESGYGVSGWPRVVQNVDLRMMRTELGVALVPAIVLLDPGHAACFVCEWKPVQGISADRHRGYAVQWFALCAALSVIVALVIRSRMQKRAG